MLSAIFERLTSFSALWLEHRDVSSSFPALALLGNSREITDTFKERSMFRSFTLSCPLKVGKFCNYNGDFKAMRLKC